MIQSISRLAWAPSLAKEVGPLKRPNPLAMDTPTPSLLRPHARMLGASGTVLPLGRTISKAGHWWLRSPVRVSKHRALFYALKHLALHVSEKIQVAIYDHQVWKNWTPHLAYENYPDLFQGLECEDFELLRPLLFSLKKLKENPLRSFLQKATSQIAKQAAAAERPTEILDLQEH